MYLRNFESFFEYNMHSRWHCNSTFWPFIVLHKCSPKTLRACLHQKLWVLRKLFDMFSVWKIIRYSQRMWYSHPITTYNLIKKFYVCINFNWHGNLWLDRSTMHPYLKITLCLHLWKQRGTVKSVKVLWVVLAQNGYGFFGFL